MFLFESEIVVSVNRMCSRRQYQRNVNLWLICILTTASRMPFRATYKTCKCNNLRSESSKFDGLLVTCILHTGYYMPMPWLGRIHCRMYNIHILYGTMYLLLLLMNNLKQIFLLRAPKIALRMACVCVRRVARKINPPAEWKLSAWKRCWIIFQHIAGEFACERTIYFPERTFSVHSHYTRRCDYSAIQISLGIIFWTQKPSLCYHLSVIHTHVFAHPPS